MRSEWLEIGTAGSTHTLSVGWTKLVYGLDMKVAGEEDIKMIPGFRLKQLHR